jgi:hypothetical protein
MLRISAWGIAAIVSLLAILAWGTDYGWHVRLNAYVIFPLLGLLAFSLMWTHYIVGALRRYKDLERELFADYFELTSLTVLALICLHPALLIYQRYRDGFGLPPGSYESYVSQGTGWLTLLGTVSLFIFLTFEFRRRYADRNWWRYVLIANDVAMVSVFYHALRLGSQIHGWFRTVWLFYGISLITFLVLKYYDVLKRHAEI